MEDFVSRFCLKIFVSKKLLLFLFKVGWKGLILFLLSSLKLKKFLSSFLISCVKGEIEFGTFEENPSKGLKNFFS